MLRKLFAGCLSPVGADSTVADGQLTLRGVVLSHNGEEKITSSCTGNLTDAVKIGVTVAELLIENGAGRFLREDRK